MARMTTFSNPLLLGFDEIERALERVARTGSDGYPPYNVERLPPADGRGEILRITLAVAGFKPDDLDVTVEEKQLIVRGKQAEDASRDFLHRGIAARQFQRSFLLADGIEVLGADLQDGLLSIDLARPVSARVARKVRIKGLA